MNEAIALLLAILIGSATLTGFFATVALLFPNQVAGAQRVIVATPGRAFVIGLVNLLFWGLLTLASFASSEQFALPFLALPGVLIAALLLVALCLGLTTIVEHAGERLLPTAGALPRALVGATVIGLGAALPFVGWFLLLPYLLLLGLGGQIIYTISRYRRR